MEGINACYSYTPQGYYNNKVQECSPEPRECLSDIKACSVIPEKATASPAAMPATRANIGFPFLFGCGVVFEQALEEPQIRKTEKEDGGEVSVDAGNESSSSGPAASSSMGSSSSGATSASSGSTSSSGQPSSSSAVNSSSTTSGLSSSVEASSSTSVASSSAVVSSSSESFSSSAEVSSSGQGSSSSQELFSSSSVDSSSASLASSASSVGGSSSVEVSSSSIDNFSSSSVLVSSSSGVPPCVPRTISETDTWDLGTIEPAGSLDKISLAGALILNGVTYGSYIVNVSASLPYGVGTDATVIMDKFSPNGTDITIDTQNGDCGSNWSTWQALGSGDKIQIDGNYSNQCAKVRFNLTSPNTVDTSQLRSYIISLCD